MGLVEVGVVYQVIYDVLLVFFGVVLVVLVSKQMVWGFGGKLDILIVMWYFGYMNSCFDVVDYKNQVVYVGVKVLIFGVLSFIGIVQYDWMKYFDISGKCFIIVGMFDYVFSKCIDVYVEVDYMYLQGSWVVLDSVVVFNNFGNLYGNNLCLGVMLGVWYKF